MHITKLIIILVYNKVVKGFNSLLNSYIITFIIYFI